MQKDKTKKVKYQMFKLKEIFDIITPSKVKVNVINDIKCDNGVFKTKNISIVSGDCITFSKRANGNIYYQPKDTSISINDSSLIVLREHELKVRNMEMGEEVGLYYVTVLKHLCKGRYLGGFDEYSVETIANWEIQLPVNRFGFVDYAYIIDYMEGIKNMVSQSNTTPEKTKKVA